MRPIVPVVALILAVVLPALPLRSAQSAALKIVVIAGEDAVNVIQQKTAVPPVVEVRDRNDLPVAGAIVTFSVPGKSAAFGPSAQTFTIATDSAGRAAAAGFNPLATGPVQINVQATYQGQTAGTTITQTNVLTAAQAAATAGSTAASAGTAAGGAAGGGLSAGAIAGIVGAGVGGAALGAAALKKEDPPPSGTAATATAPVRIAVSPSGKGLREVTEFTFTASGGSSGSPEYAWDFGDGTGTTGGQVTHVFARDGTFQVRVQEGERTEQSASRLVEVGTLTGTWRTQGVGSYFRLLMVQQGTSLTGQWLHICTGDPFCTEDTAMPLSGQIGSLRSVTISEDGICRHLLSDGTLNENLTTITGLGTRREAICIQLAQERGSPASFNLTFMRE